MLLKPPKVRFQWPKYSRASNVFTPAALNRIMRPFRRCTTSRFGDVFLTRRRSSSIPIRIKAVGKRGWLSSKYGIDLLVSSTQLGRKLNWNRPDIGLRCLGKFGEPSGIRAQTCPPCMASEQYDWAPNCDRLILVPRRAGAMRFHAGYVRETKFRYCLLLRWVLSEGPNMRRFRGVSFQLARTAVANLAVLIAAEDLAGAAAVETNDR